MARPAGLAAANRGTENDGNQDNMRTVLVATMLVLISLAGLSSAADKDAFEIETEGSYRLSAGAAVDDTARAVTLFNAKRKAVALAGRYLSHMRLIKTYRENKEEVYSLAAGSLGARILDQKQEKTGNGPLYRCRIRVRVQASDFVQAEMAAAAMEADEARKPFREEVEQPLSAEIDPGRDIAWVYLFLRQKKWRPAIIYLDHLEKKYPNWDSIYMAKAITYYILHNPVFMQRALQKACRLGNALACDDLKHLRRVHERDFGLSLPE